MYIQQDYELTLDLNDIVHPAEFLSLIVVLGTGCALSAGE
jgi:hypothetical protein